MSGDSQDNRFGISSSVDKKTLKLQNKTDNTNSNIDTVETNKTRKISTNHSTKINLINPNGLMDNLSNTDIDKNICIKCKIAQPKTTKKNKKKTQKQKQKQQERTIIRVRIGTDEGDFKIKDLKKIDYFEAIMSKRWNSGCNQNNNIDCGGIDKRYSDCNSSNFNNDSSSWNSKLKENKDCVGQKRGKIDSVESLSSGVTTDPDKSAFGPKKAKRRKISQISNDMVDTIDTVDCNVITVFGEFVQDIAATTETTRPDYTDEGKNISGVRFDCDYTGTSEMTNGNCNKNENNNNCNSSRNSSNIRNSDSGYDDFQAKQQGLRTSIERLGISFNNGMLYPFGCQELRLIIKIIDTGKIPINFNASYDTFYRLLKCDDYFSLKLINKDLINDYLLNGIPGITPKTAENIINRYKTCQRLINKHKDLKKDGKTNQTTNNNRNKTKTDRNNCNSNCNSNYTTQSDDKIFCQHRRKDKSKSKLGTFSSVNACRHRSDDKGSVSSDNVNFGNANKHRTSNNPQPTRRQSGQQIRTSTNSVYNCKCRTDGEIELEIEDDDIGSNYSNYGDLTRSSQSSCACEEMKKDSDINIERRKEQELEQILIHTQARESDLKVMHDVYECVCIELERRKENLVSSQEFALKESQIACLRDNKKVEMLSLFPDITLAKLFGHKMTVLFETMQTQGPAPQYAINPTQQQNSPHGIPQQTMIYYRAHIPNCHESERLNLNQLWQKLRNKKLHSKYFDECFDNHFRDMIDAYLRIMDGNYHIQWMDPNIKYKNFQKILICVLTNLLNDFDNNIIDRLPCTRINIIKIVFYLNINNPCSILNKEFCDKIKNYGSKLNKREYLLFLKCLIVGNERYVMRIKKYFVNNLSLMNDQSMKSISIYCDLMKYFLLKCNPSDVCKISSDWFSLLCNNSDKWIINKFVPKLTSKQRCDFATEIINYAMFRHKDGMQQLISKYKDFLVQELGLWAVESLGSM